MWTAVKIGAIIGGVLLTLTFIAILIMVTRPAVLTGVAGPDLANSVARIDQSSEGSCRKVSGGTWDCDVHGPNANGSFQVEVDWLGCWKAERTGPASGSGLPAERDGCIELGDIITFD
ncbi:MAG TPA: hypothetical protein P5138_06710 [Solirubrobacterales bacterium]|nr:hypothetical protein [Solirubrobacterales bacterium]